MESRKDRKSHKLGTHIVDCLNSSFLSQSYYLKLRGGNTATFDSRELKWIYGIVIELGTELPPEIQNPIPHPVQDTFNQAWMGSILFFFPELLGSFRLHQTVQSSPV